MFKDTPDGRTYCFVCPEHGAVEHYVDYGDLRDSSTYVGPISAIKLKPFCSICGKEMEVK